MKKTDMRHYLKNLDGKMFYYFPNPGNAGDCMIAHASFQLFRECGVKFQICEPHIDIDFSGKVVMYSGGGNLTRYHNYARNFIDKVHQNAKKLVILPHTIDHHNNLLQRLGENVDIICREEVTLQHVQKCAANARIMIADDMALNLDAQTVLTQFPRSILKIVFLKILYTLKKDTRRSNLPSTKKIVDERRVTWGFLSEKKDKISSNVLNCFRTDIEKSNIKIPPDNLDVSVTFSYGTRSEALAFYGCHRLFKFIDNFAMLRTNRLHIAIAGAILGKQVEFYPNSYFKNKAVWEFSLKNKFLNIHWMG